MKKIFKWNQLVLTGLAILLAVVGYMNFTKEEPQSVMTDKVSENSTELEDFDGEKLEGETKDIARTDDTSNTKDDGKTEAENNTKDDGKTDSNSKTDSDSEIDTESIKASQEKENIGEVVLVDNIISTDAIYDAKLSREQQRSKNKADLLKVVEDNVSTQDIKNKALNEILLITENAEKELAAETLLEAKGYNNVIVSVVDDSVDVVVDVDSITTKDATDIMDIVKRKTGVSASNIVISPVTSSTDDIQDPQ